MYTAVVLLTVTKDQGDADLCDGERRTSLIRTKACDGAN